MIKGIRTLTEIGTPYHGLATNSTLSTSDGDKTVHSPDAFNFLERVGQCVVVRHPGAPGANRNAAQQAHDTTKGYEWRDYALMVGPNRAVEGADQLGTNKWLYCDSSGPTWLIRLDHVKSGSQITFSVVLEAVYGRLGRQYPITEQTLASLVWSPVKPSWGGGSHTQADAVSAVNMDWANAIAINGDGSQAYIHVFSGDSQLNQDWYFATTPSGLKASHNQSTGLISILKCDISGTGDLGSDGNGISATLVEDLAHEGGLVTNYSAGSASSVSRFPNSYTDLLVSPVNVISCPATQTFTVFATGATSGAGTIAGVSYDAIMYKTDRGTVTRALQSDVVESFDVTIYPGTAQRQWNDVPPQGCICDTSSGTGGGATVEVTTVTTYSVEVVFFGGAPLTMSWEKTQLERQSSLTMTKDSVSYLQCDGTDWPEPSFPPDIQIQVTSEINGVATSGNDLYAAHEMRVLAQNLHYVALYISVVDNETNHDMDEHIWGVPDSGAAYELWTGTYQDTYRPASSFFRDLPDDRELVGSFQPVSLEFAHEQTTLGQVHSGDFYQYV